MKKGLLAVALLLAGLLLVADRGIARLAEAQVAERIQRDQSLSERPAVDIRGFPFLTQAARRRFGLVTMTAADVRQGDLTFSRVDASLHDVRILGQQEARVGDAQLTALLTYAVLNKALSGDRVSLSWKSGPRVRGSVHVLGGTYAATALATFAIDGSDVRIVPKRLMLAAGPASATLPGGLVSQLASRQQVDLPFGLRLRSVRAGPDGVQVRAAGTGIVLNQTLSAGVR